MPTKRISIELGFIGEQGAGKTQLMNILKERLRDHPQIVSIRDGMNPKKHHLVVDFDANPTPLNERTYADD